MKQAIILLTIFLVSIAAANALTGDVQGNLTVVDAIFFLPDVNLYRSAANVIKTDDHLIAASGNYGAIGINMIPSGAAGVYLDVVAPTGQTGSRAAFRITDEAVGNLINIQPIIGTGASSNAVSLGANKWTITQANPNPLKSKYTIDVNTGDSVQTALTIKDDLSSVFAGVVNITGGIGNNLLPKYNAVQNIGSTDLAFLGVYSQNFYDLTPFPEKTDINIKGDILNIKSDEDGNLDHSSLPERQRYVLIREKNGEPYDIIKEKEDCDAETGECYYTVTKYPYTEQEFDGATWTEKEVVSGTELKEGTFEARSIGAAVSYNVVAIQDLYEELDALKERVAALENK